MINLNIKRSDIIMANLRYKNDGKSKIQQGLRPVIITSNELCNKFSPVLTGVALTTQQQKTTLPTHVFIPKSIGLEKDSIALCEQPLSIDRYDLLYKVAECPYDIMLQIEKASDIQQKVFDINEASKLIYMIIELELEISESARLYNYVPQGTVSVRNGLFQQLIEYCNQYRVDHKTILNMCKNNYNESIGERMVV